MQTSNTIANLATALATMQAHIKPAAKNATNPFLKSSYADLESVTDAVRDLLAEHGLSYVQMPATPPVEYGPAVALTTRLMHESGEWLEETAVMAIPTEERGKSTMQVAGSAYTYLRRYALSAMLGVVTGEDDDGSGPPPNGRGETSPQAQAQRERPHWTLKDSPGRRKAFHALGTEVYGDEWDDKRKEWASMWGVESSNDFTREQVDKLMDGMLKKQAQMAKEAE